MEPRVIPPPAVESSASARPPRAEPPAHRLAPSPPGLPLIGNLGAVRADRLTAALQWRAEYGDVVRVKVGNLRAHILAHPEHVKHVLQENQRNYGKQTRGFEKLRLFLGNGLLTSEGSFWLRQRRIAQPAFHKSRIASLAGSMTRAAEEACARWEPFAASGRPFDLMAEMMRLTLRVAGETLLGTDVRSSAGAVGSALTAILENMQARMLALWDPPLTWPTRRNRRFHTASRAIDEVIASVIRDRRQALARGGPGAAPNDLLTMLMEARDEETGESMTDQQLRDEVMTIFLAGHETTAVALAWTFFFLSRAPAVERKLRAELATVLDGRVPTADDYPRLTYTRAVIQESMRLYPPVWIVGRHAIDDDVIGGYHIPKDTLVFVSPWITHRHPDFWENPEGFDPERFAPERAAERVPFSYFPFGGGPRVCIGNNFALMEAVLVVATLAQRFRLDLVPGHRVDPHPLITLRPERGVMVVARST